MKNEKKKKKKKDFGFLFDWGDKSIGLCTLGGFPVIVLEFIFVGIVIIKTEQIYEGI